MRKTLIFFSFILSSFPNPHTICHLCTMDFIQNILDIKSISDLYQESNMSNYLMSCVPPSLGHWSGTWIILIYLFLCCLASISMKWCYIKWRKDRDLQEEEHNINYVINAVPLSVTHGKQKYSKIKIIIVSLWSIKNIKLYSWSNASPTQLPLLQSL